MSLMPVLRGDPERLIAVPRPAILKSRPDGSPGGYGYFGPIALDDDPDLYTTELPTPVFDVGGHMALLIPMVVPTLTRAELAHLVCGGQPTWPIVEKAKRHADLRLTATRSPFADAEEQHPLPTV